MLRCLPRRSDCRCWYRFTRRGGVNPVLVRQMMSTQTVLAHFLFPQGIHASQQPHYAPTAQHIPTISLRFPLPLPEIPQRTITFYSLARVMVFFVPPMQTKMTKTRPRFKSAIGGAVYPRQDGSKAIPTPTRQLFGPLAIWRHLVPGGATLVFSFSLQFTGSRPDGSLWTVGPNVKPRYTLSSSTSTPHMGDRLSHRDV